MPDQLVGSKNILHRCMIVPVAAGTELSASNREDSLPLLPSQLSAVQSMP